MNRVNSGLVWVAVLMAISASAGAVRATEATAAAVQAALDRVRPAVVRIEVVTTEYRDGREIKNEGAGSGFLIRTNGYLITNHHVAGRARRAVCVFANNEELDATVVGTDPLTDITVLRLDDPQRRVFPICTWGDSDAVTVGDTVLAVGSPLALSQSVTRGIVSNTRMVMPGLVRRFVELTIEGEDVGSLVRWIAHDAPIYPGNSGGPLVNLRGDVIGVNEISLGLGGAIPSNLARAVAEQLIERGEVVRGWLGMSVRPLLKSGERQRGALVASVVPGGPAGQAGVEVGDVVLALNEQPVAVRFEEELPMFNQQVAALTPGQPVRLVIQRHGEPRTLTIVPERREPLMFPQRELPEWGITARNLSRAVARELKLEHTRGVMVTSVRPGRGAGDAKPPLQARDVIVAVEDQAIDNVDDLVRWTARVAAWATSVVPVRVEFRRGSERLMTVVRIGLREWDDLGHEVRKAWLPVAVQTLTRDLAAQLGLPGQTGVRITRVHPGFRAAEVLEVGDLIIAVDDESIPASQPGDEEVFFNRIRQYRIGDTVTLTVRRGEESLRLRVGLERAPPLPREMRKLTETQFEFSARDLSFQDRFRSNLGEEVTGVLVTEVQSGGWAALGDLRVDDIIQRVDGTAVADVASLERKIEEVRRARPRYVLFQVLRGIHTLLLEIEPQWHTIESR